MDPITVAFVVGTAIKIGSTIKNAMAEKEAADQAERAARLNMQLALELEAEAQARGVTEAGKARRLATRIVGEQKANLAAGGIDLASGAVADLAAQTKHYSELDIMTIQNNAAKEALGYRRKAEQFKEEMKAADKRGHAAVVSGFLGVAAQTGTSAYGMNEAGMFGSSSQNLETTGTPQAMDWDTVLSSARPQNRGRHRSIGEGDFVLGDERYS
jgi:hypothetical protein